MESGSFLKEFVGRILLVALVVLGLSFAWWLPLIIAPIFWQAWDTPLGRRARITQPAAKVAADLVTHAIWLGYILYSIISFGFKVGHWYGWLAGAIIGLVVAQFMGLLWPHRWHLERVDGNI